MLTFLLFLFHHLNFFRLHFKYWIVLLGFFAADVLKLVDVEIMQQLMAVGATGLNNAKNESAKLNCFGEFKSVQGVSAGVKMFHL